MLIPESGNSWAIEGVKSLDGKSEAQQSAEAIRINSPTRENQAMDAILMVWTIVILAKAVLLRFWFKRSGM